MSIYKNAMGEAFYQLHPMLQKRYGFPGGGTFTGKGTMKKINGGPKWLHPLFLIATRWKLLFPEHGENVPFQITNTPCTGKSGEDQIHWERVFYFRKKKRYFNALMSLDAERNIIKDYLGEPHLIYSDLSLSATRAGGLKIESKQQRLVIGLMEIPLPKIFQGLATITEKYDDEKEVYLINVFVTNPLIGTVFSYEGEFASDDVS
ncbi:DUF4166 domain-containing protein [Virgibacillus doumboii]|uniref:DUF4166 domain-containing protein n=1 Tax=Virgibacillus doumboii TaxID=2697503 RepID=UPI001FE73FFA|nr:DUF4166 domain-containing protein [Virgibacillus doumboii]